MKLIDTVRLAMRTKHYSPRTEEAYVDWIVRYIRFHGVRHPADMGAEEVSAFLTDLAVNKKLSASSQNQALAGLLFLCRHVLRRELDDIGEFVRAKRPRRLPVVVTTMTYLHLTGSGAYGVRSPLDREDAA